MANEERREGERDSEADATANLPMDTDGDGREGRGLLYKMLRLNVAKKPTLSRNKSVAF